MLDTRKKAILFVAVQEYILTAEPVSSQRLVEKYQLGVSSATVRNELALLEDLGYLRQPHTSAGRIPTDIGYRFYVDNTLDKPGLTVQEEEAVTELFSAVNREMGAMLHETTQILSHLTNYVAVVLAPSFKKSTLKHVDLVSISSRHVLAVLITNKGQVLKRIITIELADKGLSGIEHFLNERLQGMGPAQISALKEGVDLADRDTARLIRHLIGEIADIMASEDKERVFLGGTSSILRQREFEDLNKIEALLNSLEHGYRLLQWLEDSLRTEKVLVKIGSENTDQQIKDCTVIASSYHIDGETLGTLGIIGPTRMDYARAISSVTIIADNLTRALTELRSG